MLALTNSRWPVDAVEAAHKQGDPPTKQYPEADSPPAPQWDIEDVRRIVLTMLMRYAANVWLFGSAVRSAMAHVTGC